MSRMSSVVDLATNARIWSAQICSAIVLVMLSTQPTPAEDVEDQDLPPGILGRYSLGETSVERIEDGLSFQWLKSPDPKLPEGNFAAEWSGMLIVQQPGSHTFHSFVQGEVEVEVAGRKVLSGKANKPSWISGEASVLEGGLQPLTVRFRKTSSTAEFHLYWSAAAFPLEPIPSHLLLRDGGRPDLALIETGRELAEAHRCVRCHGGGDAEETPLGPDLSTYLSDVPVETVRDRLTKPHSGAMPHFGMSDEQADLVAAFLDSRRKPVKTATLPKPKPGRGRDDAKDRQSGLVLIRSTGCLACHSFGDEGSATPFGGGDLAKLSARRSQQWLYTWLTDPAKLNRDHRMPVFSLTSTERRQLALALSTRKVPHPLPPEVAKQLKDKDRIRRGREIVVAARCVNCHRIDGLKPDDSKSLKSLTQVARGRANSCLSAKPNRTNWRPAFNESHRKAIEAWLSSVKAVKRRPTEFERGRQLLVSRNCTACHPRHGIKGLAATAAEISAGHEELRGRAPSLVPPNLTSVGDKLIDAALEKSISGEQKRRMDWLHARMPKFKHSAAEKKALLSYLIGHDRIPDGAPTWKLPADDTRVDDQTLLLGQELVGVKGFSCIACHQVGSYVPRKAAMGARGSDLIGLGNRMRHSYFIRWTRSPLRIVPGVEMPSYTRAVKGVLNDDADAQLEVLWKTLADPRFEPPTNPASVEQFFVVKSDSPARIIRDVFTNPADNGGGYVARSLAIGFENGHSALFDLDSLTLRRWTFGDFARQRTVGKSWYWDMAGSDVVTSFGERTGYALVANSASDSSALDAAVYPEKEHGTVGRLIDYSPYQKGLQFRYRLNFEIDETTTPIEISERVLPRSINSGRQSGWTREINVSSIPAGYDLIHISYAEDVKLGKPLSIGADGAISAFLSAQRKTGSLGSSLRLKPQNGTTHFRLRYTATLNRPDLSVTLKPQPPEKQHKITSAPGFDGVQLPLSTKIMPTSMTSLDDGTLAFASLEGHVYLARDTDGDGVEDSLTQFEEGLAAPYGILADGDSLLVSHKPELLRLRDTDGDGKADQRSVFSTGWGHNDNYHDWTCGIVRDSKGNLYVGLGSDYGQPKRPKEVSRWRGKVVQISPEGVPRPFSHAFRYPTGLAIDSQDRLFATDNQGVQNTFNEINHLRDGLHYGVPKNHEQSIKVDAHPPAIQVPHPWTRSVNGITFLPQDYPIKSIAGHGIGCEFNGRRLVRFTYHEVDGILQGAVFHFTNPDYPDVDANFLGPLSISVSPGGEIYVGSIHDSGWLGGLNTGSIVKLTPNGKLPAGIRDIRATAEGFELQFTEAVDKAEAAKPENYSISGYTRKWGGGYATPDSGRYQPDIESVDVSADGKSARLNVAPLKTGFVFEINCRLKVDDEALWPATGHYTLHRIPGKTAK